MLSLIFTASLVAIAFGAPAPKSIAVPPIQKFNIKAFSDSDPEVNDSYLHPIRGGAGISFTYITGQNEGMPFQFEGESLFYHKDGDVPQAALIFKVPTGVPLLEFGILPDDNGEWQTPYDFQVYNDQTHIAFNHTVHGWYACKDAGDFPNINAPTVAFYMPGSPVDSRCSKIMLKPEYILD